MSALRRVKKVKGGYEVTVKCTNTPREERVFSTSEECHAFADEYLEKNYFGVSLTNIHHPVGNGVEPEGVNPDSLESVEIEIPMNERLKQLAEQAGMHYRELCDEFAAPNTDGVPLEMLKRFAELIRLDETKACAKHYLEIMREAVEQAVLKERAACAKLCESMGVYPELNVYGGGPDWYKRQKECATAIRQRGEK